MSLDKILRRINRMVHARTWQSHIEANALRAVDSIGDSDLLLQIVLAGCTGRSGPRPQFESVRIKAAGKIQRQDHLERILRVSWHNAVKAYVIGRITDAKALAAAVAGEKDLALAGAALRRIAQARLMDQASIERLTEAYEGRVTAEREHLEREKAALEAQKQLGRETAEQDAHDRWTAGDAGSVSWTSRF